MFNIMPKVPVFLVFPLSHGNGVDTIVIYVKIMRVHVENSSFDELEPEISWVKGVPGKQTGGTPPGAFWRPLETWRRVLRTMLKRT